MAVLFAWLFELIASIVSITLMVGGVLWLGSRIWGAQMAFMNRSWARLTGQRVEQYPQQAQYTEYR